MDAFASLSPEQQQRLKVAAANYYTELTSDSVVNHNHLSRARIVAEFGASALDAALEPFFEKERAKQKLHDWKTIVDIYNDHGLSPDPDHPERPAGTPCPYNLDQLSSLPGLKEMREYCDRRFDLISTECGRAHYLLPDGAGELKLASSREGVVLNKLEALLARRLKGVEGISLCGEHHQKHLWSVSQVLNPMKMAEVESHLGVSWPRLEAFLNMVEFSRTMNCPYPDPLDSTTLSKVLCSFIHTYDQVPTTQWADPSLFGADQVSGQVYIRASSLAKLIHLAPAEKSPDSPSLSQ